MRVIAYFFFGLGVLGMMLMPFANMLGHPPNYDTVYVPFFAAAVAKYLST